MSEKGQINCEIEQLKLEIAELDAKSLQKADRLRELILQRSAKEASKTTNELTNDDIGRYSRQLILPGFGVQSQLKLKKSSFLIVGAGGLGCPAAQYLVAAGCGHLGLVDYDEVDQSNFHRQTLHTETRLGMPKVLSAKLALQSSFQACKIDTYKLLLNSENALDIVGAYDVVLDCSDNVATRYLLNDACVLLHKPLISGSALQLDGQLTVYHYGEAGPCYRCIFPVPPPPETVTNCGDGGVLGAVTGVIGSLQALEAIKVAVGLGEVLAGRLLIFDGANSSFRNIKLRGRRSDCYVCSSQPMITRLIDYEQFCGMNASDKGTSLALLQPEERISAQEYKELRSQPHLLVDVRQAVEFAICQLPSAINVPIKTVLDDTFAKLYASQFADEHLPIIVVCRRGNDSQLAVQHLRKKFPQRSIRDIKGGMHAHHYEVDEGFPIY